MIIISTTTSDRCAEKLGQILSLGGPPRRLRPRCGGKRFSGPWTPRSSTCTLCCFGQLFGRMGWGEGGRSALSRSRSLSLSHHLFSLPSLPLSLSLSFWCRHKSKKQWSQMRKDVRRSVNKVRWPVSKEQIRPARGGGTIVSGRQSGPAWSVRQDK